MLIPQDTSFADDVRASIGEVGETPEEVDEELDDAADSPAEEVEPEEAEEAETETDDSEAEEREPGAKETGEKPTEESRGEIPARRANKVLAEIDDLRQELGLAPSDAEDVPAGTRVEKATFSQMIAERNTLRDAVAKQRQPNEETDAGETANNEPEPDPLANIDPDVMTDTERALFEGIQSLKGQLQAVTAENTALRAQVQPVVEGQQIARAQAIAAEMETSMATLAETSGREFTQADTELIAKTAGQLYPFARVPQEQMSVEQRMSAAYAYLTSTGQQVGTAKAAEQPGEKPEPARERTAGRRNAVTRGGSPPSGASKVGETAPEGESFEDTVRGAIKRYGKG